MDTNVIVVVGRLAGVPQLTPYKTQEGKEGHRCWFRLATTRKMDRGKEGKRRVSFLPVVVWGEQARVCAQYLDKGTEVTVTGELVQDQILNEDGTFKEEHISIRAEDVQFGRRSEKNQSAEQLQGRIDSLQARLAAMPANGEGMPSPAEIPTPNLTAPGTNPFDEPAESVSA